MGEFNSDDCYIYYCGQESLRRNGVAIMVNKSPKCSTWMQSQKWQNDLCLFPRQTIQYHSNPSLSLVPPKFSKTPSHQTSLPQIPLNHTFIFTPCAPQACWVTSVNKLPSQGWVEASLQVKPGLRTPNGSINLSTRIPWSCRKQLSKSAHSFWASWLPLHKTLGKRSLLKF